MTLPDPVCLSVMLCDQVIEDKRTGKKSLIGVFNEILVTNLPAKHDCMFLLLTLTNCRGVNEIRIDLSHDGEYDDEPMMQIKGQVQGRSPMDIIDLIFELRGLPIPNPGKYTIDVHNATTGNRLAQRLFFVRKLNPPAQQDAHQNQ